MKERPMLFSGPMVRAILDGRKTQTRRLVKPQPNYVNTLGVPFYPDGKGPVDYRCCPYGQPGDRLWVKETFAYAGPEINLVPGFVYRATDPDWSTLVGFRWKPSIFCTRAASRITIEITAIRIERLNDISQEDALAEGMDVFEDGAGFTVPPNGAWHRNPEDAFRDLWQSINGPDSWSANPWVWVVEFKALPPRLRASA